MNPFSYGQIVTGQDFADREKELKAFLADLAGPSRIFLVSRRRYGKSSLIMETLNAIKAKGHLAAYIDFFR